MRSTTSRPRLHRLWTDIPLRRKALAIAALPWVPLLVGILLSVQNETADARHDAQIGALREAKAGAQQLEKALLDAETGVRGFLITGDRTFLDPYHAALRGLPEKVKEFITNPEIRFHLSVKDLQRAIARELSILERLQAGHRRPGTTSRERLLLATGRRTMDVLRAELTTLIATVDAETAEARSIREAARDKAGISLLVITLLTLAAMGGGMWLLSTNIVRRVQLASENARRLPNRLDLLPAPPGKDEIGQLTGAVERTAQLLAAQERAREQTEIALRDAKETAESANQAKSDFLSRMSHELRTPLNGILGFAQLLEMDGLPPDHRESVEHITKAGRHLLDLINEVLDLARIEAGRFSISLEPVDLHEIVDECVTLITPLAADREIRISTNGDGLLGNAYVKADRQRLKQVLLNLLSNAIKYNRKGGEIKITSAMHSIDHVEIEVADTGLGIPSEKLDRLFTAFDRLDVTDEQEQGTGLGLALSKRLAEVMGGTLRAASAAGEGSRFTIVLESAIAAHEEPAIAARIESTRPISQVKSTILYIEDNVANVRLIERIFKRRPNVSLQTVMQGQLGLDLAREILPDLVLLDLNLPDMNGDEVLLRLQQDSTTSSIPVVLLSADATERQITRMLGAGAAAYVTKPIDVSKFLATIDEVLTGTRHG